MRGGRKGKDLPWGMKTCRVFLYVPVNFCLHGRSCCKWCMKSREGASPPKQGGDEEPLLLAFPLPPCPLTPPTHTHPWDAGSSGHSGPPCPLLTVTQREHSDSKGRLPGPEARPWHTLVPLDLSFLICGVGVAVVLKEKVST